MVMWHFRPMTSQEPRWVVGDVVYLCETPVTSSILCSNYDHVFNIQSHLIALDKLQFVVLPCAREGKTEDSPGLAEGALTC